MTSCSVVLELQNLDAITYEPGDFDDFLSTDPVRAL